MGGTGLGVFILPALMAFCLPGRKVSIPIGAVTFWAWLMLTSDLLREADPSYDSMAPAFNVLFGLPVGFAYSIFWFAIGKRWKPQRHGRMSHVFSVVCWSLMGAGCVGFPFLVSLKYHRGVTFHLEYTLLAAGPLFVFSVAMVITSLWQWRKLDRELLDAGSSSWQEANSEA